MKQTFKIKTDLAEVAGINPARIAVVYGDTIYVNRETPFTCLIDLDDLPSWGDVANDREFYLGDITYIPCDDENGYTKYISAKWGDRIYGGYAYLEPLKGAKNERIKKKNWSGSFGLTRENR